MTGPSSSAQVIGAATAPRESLYSDSHATARLLPYLPLLIAGTATFAFAVSAIEPWPVGVFQDDGAYVVLAKSLASGSGYRFANLPGEPNATHFPPGYPAFLALLWKVWSDFPRNVLLFKFANAVLTAIAACCTVFFARRRLGLSPIAATVVALAFTACAPVILLTTMVLSEPLFLAALFPVLLLAERAAASGRDRDALMAGAAGACLALVRSIGVVVIPATLLVMAWRRRWRPACLAAIAGIAVLLPWQLWVSAHAHEIPEVLSGKYGSYSGWLAGGIAEGRLSWLAQVATTNLNQIVAQGWASVSADQLPAGARWISTLLLLALISAGWWRLLKQTPVAAWSLAAYVALVVTWPFAPARFLWAVWPLIGCTVALGAGVALAWRPPARSLVLRSVAVAAMVVLAAGYVRYNWLGVRRNWWTQVQSEVATRARPLAEWAMVNTEPTDLLATDDDILLYLYTGRQAVPIAAFAPRDHVRRPPPELGAATLREILGRYDIDYVLTATEHGRTAVRSLLAAPLPELVPVRSLEVGAVFAPTRNGHSRVSQP